MAEDMGDKTEAPTPKRRQEAREQGNIAKSPDLTAAVLLIGALMLLRSFGGGLITALRNVVQQMLTLRTFADLSSAQVGTIILHAAIQVGIAMAPLLTGVLLNCLLV